MWYYELALQKRMLVTRWRRTVNLVLAQANLLCLGTCLNILAPSWICQILVRKHHLVRIHCVCFRCDPLLSPRVALNQNPTVPRVWTMCELTNRNEGNYEFGFYVTVCACKLQMDAANSESMQRTITSHVEDTDLRHVRQRRCLWLHRCPRRAP